MSIRNCVTHSHACDCREEKFRLLEQENKELKEKIATIKLENNDQFIEIQELKALLREAIGFVLYAVEDGYSLTGFTRFLNRKRFLTREDIKGYL